MATYYKVKDHDGNELGVTLGPKPQDGQTMRDRAIAVAKAVVGPNRPVMDIAVEWGFVTVTVGDN